MRLIREVLGQALKTNPNPLAFGSLCKNRPSVGESVRFLL